MKTVYTALGMFGLVALGACGAGDDGGEGSLDTSQEAVSLSPRFTHFVGVTTGGGLRHALRSNTTWTSFGDVEGVAGDIGTVTRAAAATDPGEDMHLAAIGNSKIFHAVRRWDKSWTGFFDLGLVIGSKGSYTSVGAGDGGDPVFCATTSDGKAWITQRNSANGNWAGWTDLKSRTASNPGTFTSIDCVEEFSSAVLHVVTTTSDGKVWHARRNSAGTWSAFGNVSAATGSGSVYRDVDVDFDGINIQVVATGSGFQHHAARFASDESWSVFSDIATVATDPGSERRGGVVFLDDGLHVAVTVSGGGLFEAVRKPDSFWIPYANVRTATGTAESFSDVDLAGVEPQFVVK